MKSFRQFIIEKKRETLPDPFDADYEKKIGEIEKKTSVENLRTIEAEEITKILSNSGRIQLKLPTTTAAAQEDSFATRGAKLSDICILLRDRPSSTKIEAALEEAGIPYRWEGSSNIFSSQEIKDLINCLTSAVRRRKAVV